MSSSLPPRRADLLVRILAVSIGLSACGCVRSRGLGDDLDGVASVALTHVPEDATCLRLVIRGHFKVERRVGLRAGENTTFIITKLPLGDVTFTGFAYGEDCNAVRAKSVPTWLSEPVEAELSRGHRANVLLHMHRNAGQAEVSVDFEADDQSSPDGGGCSDGGDDAAELLDLSTSRGALSPEFDPAVLHYSLDVPIGTQTVTLTPSASDGASVAIDGHVVQPGEDFVTPVLQLGYQPFTLTVMRGAYEARTYTVEIGRGTDVAYLKASNTNADYFREYFGSSVAISGDTIVVGAMGETSAATGVNDATVGQADTSSESAGAAYVFVHAGGRWIQQAYLKASNTNAYDGFGNSVAISGDTVVVGASGESSAARGVNDVIVGQTDNSARASGAAYVFVRGEDGNWSQQAYLKASNTGLDDWFGTDVAISGDTIVIGAPGEASAAMGVDVPASGQSDDSASLAGAAYVFVRSAERWTQQAYLKASNTDAQDYFGMAVDVSGDAIVVGAFGESSAAAGVTQDGTQQADDSAGRSGASYVFERSDGKWTQAAYLKASNTGAGDAFGYSVSVSGDTIVVGAVMEASAAKGVDDLLIGQADNSANGAGAAYVFVRNAATWEQEAYLKASNTDARDAFGQSVDISDDIIVVGAYWEDSAATSVNDESIGQADNSMAGDDSGAAYMFERRAGTWTQQAYLKATNTGSFDSFGQSVGVADDWIIVGASLEDSAAKGLEDESVGQSDNSALNSGAAYVY